MVEKAGSPIDLPGALRFVVSQSPIGMAKQVKHSSMPLVTYGTAFGQPSATPVTWISRVAQQSGGTVTACTVASAAIVAIVTITFQTPVTSEVRISDPRPILPSIDLEHVTSANSLGDPMKQLNKSGARTSFFEDRRPGGAVSDPAASFASAQGKPQRRETVLNAPQVPSTSGTDPVERPSSFLTPNVEVAQPGSVGTAQESLAASSPSMEVAAGRLMVDADHKRAVLTADVADRHELLADTRSLPALDTLAEPGSAQASVDSLISAITGNGGTDTKSDLSVPASPILSESIPVEGHFMASGLQAGTPGQAERIQPAPRKLAEGPREHGALLRTVDTAIQAPRARMSPVPRVEGSARPTGSTSRIVDRPVNGSTIGRGLAARNRADAQGADHGQVTSPIEVSYGQLVSVQLSALLDLLEAKMDKPLYVWLKTSASADRFVTPETLAKAGIVATYDPATEQLILSLKSN